jgi:DNA-directed RNA polymerase specialized sigma24 family protein
MLLSDYLHQAKKIVHRKYGKNFSCNEELIGEVAGYMMNSDNTFDGRGTLEGRRYTYALYGISNYLRRQKSYKTEQLPDLGYINLDISDILEEVDRLPNPQGFCIREHYLNSRTYRDISKDVNVSHEMVRLYINSGIKTLKERLND